MASAGKMLMVIRFFYSKSGNIIMFKILFTIFPLLCFLGIFACSGINKPKENMSPTFTTRDAKALIPQAAAISKDELEEIFQKVAEKGGNINTLLLSNNEPLTLLIFEYSSRIRREPKYLAEFNLKKYEEKENVYYFPDAIELAKAISKGYDLQKFVTAIHPEYIIDCTCTVKGSTAKGVVHFKANDVYEGRVSYIARLGNGEWNIDEFHFPQIGLGTVLNQERRWKIYEADHFNPRRFEIYTSDDLDKKPSKEIMDF